MNLIPEIAGMHEQGANWRRNIHAHPELAFEESRTADFIAEKLTSWGIEVSRGIAKTGLVGTLKVGSSSNAIGLRADMDALPMDELNDFEHKSTIPGRMHGCGHDGHTVMLLTAAKYLSETRNFNGTVQFIFQPAEEANEAGSGAKTMIGEGLFDRFPVDSVFAMHNAPGLPVGKFSVKGGPTLASMDLFDIKVTGHGTHAALPHTGVDTILVCGQILTALQSVVSRNTDPIESAVVSVTSIHAGDSYNVLPENAAMRGTIRTFSTVVRELVINRVKILVETIAKAYGVKAEFTCRLEYAATINDSEQAEFSANIAREIVGDKMVLTGSEAIQGMGSEDFAFMLQECPGAYLFLGNGDGESACMVHEAKYDFNDEIIPIGASFFARLVEEKLK